MKSNWQIKEFGDLMVENPKSSIKVREALPKGKYIFFRSGDKTKFSNTYLCTGENIFLATGGKAVVKYFVGDASYSTDTYAIKGRPGSATTKYLYYFLLLNLHDINKKMFAGAAMKHLQKDDLKALKVPTASIVEQKRIIHVLDQVFDEVLIAKTVAEKNLQNTKDLFGAYLETLLTRRNLKWKEKTLEDVSLQFGRGRSKHRPRNDKKLYNGNYPFIQTGDIRNSNHFITEYSQTYNEIGLRQSKLWPRGTLCITIAANIAETGILTFDACFPDSVIGLIVNSKEADTNFVEYLLQSFKAVLKAKGKGSAQDNINMATFEYEKFPFPSVAEQKTIAKKLDALSVKTRRLEEIYDRKLAAMAELKKSVLKKAFTAQL